jgi:hypothetical protein
MRAIHRKRDESVIANATDPSRGLRRHTGPMQWRWVEERYINCRPKPEIVQLTHGPPDLWRLSKAEQKADAGNGNECGTDGSQRDAEAAQKFSPACFLTALLCAFGSDALAHLVISFE